MPPRKSFRFLAPLILVLWTAVNTLTAQAPPERRGPFAVGAHAFSLAEGSPIAHELRFKRVGDQSTTHAAPVVPNPYSGPDYSLQSMFPNDHEKVEIDAISTGNDFLPVDATGSVVPPSDRWAALVVSVDSAATGVPGGWVEHRASFPGSQGPGSDLVSYLFPGSNGIAPELIGHTFLEQRREDIGLTPGADIDATDWFMPLLALNNGASGGVLFINTNEVYFSVTTASAAQLGPAFFAGAPASGATILKITWSGGAWSAPSVHATPAALGLENGHDVDAVGYRPSTGTTIFSTRKDAALGVRPQLEVIPTPGTGPFELTTNTGASLPPSFGLNAADEIDSICGIDPESHFYSTWLSTPAWLDTPKSAGFSISRNLLGRDPRGGLMQVTGWGRLTPSNGSAVLYFYSLDGELSWLAAPSVVPRGLLDYVVETPTALPPPVPAGFPGWPVSIVALLVDGTGRWELSGVQRMRL